MICSQCGKQNPKTAKFCASCGHELAAACPMCGTPVVAGARFCAECGQDLTEKTSERSKKQTTRKKKSEPPAPVAESQMDDEETAPSGKKKPVWMWAGLGLIGLLIVAGTALAFFYEIDIDLFGTAPTETAIPAIPEPTITPALLAEIYEDTSVILTQEACLIAYSGVQENAWNIYQLDVSQGTVKQLTQDDQWLDSLPSFSPFGDFIAFNSKRGENFSIFIMDGDGGNVSQLTSDNSMDTIPSWSPDGMHIAFSSDREGEESIYIMDFMGDNIRRLTENYDYSASWSPDGKQIVFASEINPAEAHLYIVNTDGSDLSVLLEDGSHFFPDWSPVGNQIAFTSVTDDGEAIFVIKSHGSDLRQLTFPQGWNDYGPVWSPDGEYIAYITSRHTGSNEIYVMKADGSDPTQLTHTGGFITSLDWSPACAGFEGVFEPYIAPPSAPQADAVQPAPTPGPVMPPSGGMEIPPEAAGLILNLDVDRDRFHCIRANGPATLTITADVSDQDRGLALFWRLVEKNSGWTLDWENVSMQRAGSIQRKYTFNADVTAGTNNFGYPPGMGEAWFQFQVVTGDRAIRTPVYRDAVTFFPCAQ